MNARYAIADIHSCKIHTCTFGSASSSPIMRRANLLASLLVRSIDLLLVLIQDRLAIQLLRRRRKALGFKSASSIHHFHPRSEYKKKHTHILRRPLLPRQHNPRNNLDPRQPGLLPRILHLLQHRGNNLVIMHEFLDVLARDADVLRHVLERFLRGHDDGDGLGFVWVRVDADVVYDGRGAVA